MAHFHNFQIPGYNTLEVIHSGANTNIYGGTVVATHTPVILKVLLDDYFCLEAIARFKHEYSISAKLDHPNIVKVLTLESYDKRLALVFEDFGGISLKQYLEAHKPSVQLTLQVAVAIASALAYIHDNHIIHKDVKPANIIIATAGGMRQKIDPFCTQASTSIIKLTDFSIASRLSKETPQLINPNQLEGTLAYMSPEQTGRMNRNLDYRSDFYSLGLTLYEMLTGQLPFTNDEPLELVHAHIAKQPTPIQQLVPNVPSTVAAIVHKLMAKNAEDRYQSAKGLLADLQQCLEQLNTTGNIADFTPGRLDILSQLLIPQKLYGRETQVEKLLSSFDRVSSGKSELVLVSGYSGVGKTSVINEINKPITKARGYFISGKFDQFKRDIPYVALVQAFSSLMRQLLTESAEKLEVWRSRILQAVSSNGQVIIDVIPKVELIIGKQPEVPQLGLNESQNRFHRVFQQFLKVFCCQEHPLVIFLDDLQWADLATLKLIHLLMCHVESKYLLLIGAYRDNEVSKGHPLLSIIEEIKETSIDINDIVLQSLELDNVIQFIGDTLNDDIQRTIPLAEIIFKKTNGNPFFITQLLKVMYQELLLVFDFNKQQWQWDIEKIIMTGILDKSVVDLVANRLNILPGITQKLLQLAACIGDKFTLNLLSALNKKSVYDTAVEIDAALEAGLILPMNEAYRIPLLFQAEENISFDSKDISYKFLHDRVQQAAYSLIPDNQKKENHIIIGRLLLENTLNEERNVNIFDIVNHFNKSIELLQEIEKDKLIELNLIAGRKAKKATAYEPALNYLMVGIKLLRTTSWLTHYETTLDLYEEAAEAAYLCGDFEQMHHLANIVIQKANCLLDTIKVYNLRILTAIAQKKLQESLEIGLQTLKKLEIDFPEELTDEFVNQVLTETESLIPRYNLQSLLNLPTMTDLNSIAAMEILDTISTAAYSVSPKLMLLINLLRIKLSLLHGNCSSSAIAYAAYGLIQCGLLNNYELGYEFGTIALNLASNINQGIHGKVLFYASNFLFHWKTHLREMLHFSRLGAKYSLESGDLEYTAWSYQFECRALYWQGEELNSLKHKIENDIYAIRLTKQEQPLSHQYMLYQVILNLMDRSQDACHLVGEVYNEEQSLAQYQAINDVLGIYFFHLYKLILCYLFGQYDRASTHANIAATYLSSAMAQVVVPIFYFYDSLIQLVIYNSQLESEQKHILSQVQANQEKMQKWAELAPMNYLHKFYLVEAEIYRCRGENYQAMDYYDRAITLAQSQGYIQEVAIANELASLFYLELGKEKIAKAYIHEAHYSYIRWGAIAKATNLEERYPDILTPISQRVLSHTSLSNKLSTSTKSLSLDILTVVKASQALSSEIVLDSLLEKLMCLVKENAGAQKVFFIAKDNDRLVIEASLIEEGNITTLQSLLIAEHQVLPVSVIHYVERTQKPLVLDDATLDDNFNHDPYIVTYRPKSILVSPIIYQGRLTGILYLENNLTTHAFTKDRLEVLHILSAQAAISIENSCFYATLETRVKERTQQLEDKNQQLQTILGELQRTQAQLIHHEKMSSLGQLVAGIAHEINNPINFIYVNLTYLSEYTDSLLDLLSSYQKDYPNPSREILEKIDDCDMDFIKDDMPKLLSSMKIGAERIRDIVKSLRNFSRLDESAVKEVDLHEGIKNTLMILQQKLQGIEVIKDYEILPKISCDASQINQVFLHLLTNAIDALSEKSISLQMTNNHNLKYKPTIWIGTEVDRSKQAVIRITDNGIGINNDVKSKIFNPFFTTKQVGKGTGLGLSISYQIVTEKHGGSLECISSPGEGTTFIIKIPYL
ncbi:AAA family ATPase [Scytonema sp. UIC 10036]|uniref:AAA family ATPase n=1 Tax=Scytonema sp. UIC 10036 TaxID=2304196 RepID=UPI00137CB6F6|nr:AAA family ATPase [Scytonema sp. UIC 10036]